MSTHGIVSDDSGTGSVIVLLHGFCETRETWGSFAAGLRARFRVLVPDLPGFGESDSLSEGFTIDDVGKRMLDWMLSANIQKCVIIGHSLGGYVALSMAKQAPGLFSGVGLFHSTAYADSAEKKANRNKVIDFVDRNGVEAYTDSFVAGLFYKKDDPAIRSAKAIAARTQADALTGYAAAMRDRTSSVGFLEACETPILFIAGVHDAVVPPSQTEDQASLCKRPMFRAVPEAAHMGMLEQSLGTQKIVQEFTDLCVHHRPESL